MERGHKQTVIASSIVECAAKWLRASDSLNAYFYLSTRFTLPPSNMCKRFFLISDFAMKNRRKELLPSDFEAQIILVVNRDY